MSRSHVLYLAWHGIWIRLEERGIHGKFLNANKAVYDEVIIRVKINGKYGDDLKLSLGLNRVTHLAWIYLAP